MTLRGKLSNLALPPASVLIYITAMAVVASGLLIASWWTSPFDIKPWWLFLLCAMSVLSWWLREQDIGARIPLSFTSIVLVASVALVGPAGTAVVGAVAHFGDLSRTKWYVRVFNFFMTIIIGALGGLAYLAVGGSKRPATAMPANSLWRSVAAPLLMADVVICLANAFLLAGIVKLTQGVPVRRFTAGMLSSSGPAYIGYGVIGLLFVILWIPAGVGPFSAVLVLAPLLVARWAFVQYGDEQRVHHRTLNALVTAVEAKDPYTRGHSERVATLCELTAATLNMGPQRAEALRFAGLLHDIGKLGIPTRILRATDSLSENDLDEIALHPERGMEMVREIGFLKESAQGILQHHERHDGRGYPLGLSGDSIHEFGRVIAVADAFDSMTTNRAHRDALTVDEALAELRRRGGTQFDPTIVDAFERAIVRHDWQPTLLPPSLLATAGAAFDHDDPAASDLFAERANSRHLGAVDGGPAHRGHANEVLR